MVTDFTMPETSTKPYLIRAIYGWCTDNGSTPYIAVPVDNNTNVPREFVKNGEIVLNVSFGATSQLDMGNEWIMSYARFSGVSRKTEVSIENMPTVYARENGQGMAFPVECSTPATQVATERKNNPPSKLAAVDSELASASVPTEAETGPGDEPTPPNVPCIGGKPALKAVK